MKKLVNKMLQSAGLLALVVGSVGVLSFGVSPLVHADCDSGTLSIQSGADCGQGTDQPANLFDGDESLFKKITNVMLFIIGAISVIMLIVGGIKYTVSGGDQGAVQSAKNTIMYAIVGIIVAILAYAVVNFVTKSFAGGN